MTSIWTGERVCLRAIEPDDWQAFMELDSFSDDLRSADMLHPPRSAHGYRKWAEERAEQKPDVGDSFWLAITTREDGTVVGSMTAGDIDLRAGRFSYGVTIGPAYKRRGYASEAVRLLLTFFFGERRMHKCEVGIYAFNEPSIELHRKLGFALEGRLRDHEYISGRYHDLVLMGCTATEFTDRFPRDS